MSAARRLAVAWRVLRAEGGAAVRARSLDRLAEAVRRQGFTPAPPGWAPDDPIPVLLVTSAPPVPWLGGVPAQLRTRLEAEQRARSVALLAPEGKGPERGWRLEIRTGAERRFLDFFGEPLSPAALEDAPFEEAVRRSAEIVGARAIHVEGLAGLPLRSLRRLAGELGILLSLHDFAAFCPRPHLLERPMLRFCEYSRDLDRCGRCLARSWPVDGGFQAERRRIAADLLATADVLVFPSHFLENAHLELFQTLAAGRRVLEPPLTSTVALPRPATSEPVRHVALVGGVQPHKGAREFIELVRRLSGKGSREGAGQGVRWSSYGGGDAELSRELRALGVRVHGYYRQGTLPHLLRRDGVDLALLLSVVPESHSLVLGECVVAGVPVVALGLGALAERVPRLEAGRLVDPRDGVDGVAAAVRNNLRDGVPQVPAEATRRLTDPVSAAAGHLALYRELGLTD